ncbi:MAG: DUF362 domain-containing protein [Candidatus Bathyarchaeota archaeon]|nr:DUF362 domain-containing protein [Candidatus Bathyarchaeota archaeon]
MRIGAVVIEKSNDPSIYEKIISELNLKPPVIIKPNWGTVNNYTEAEVIDGVLSAINGEAIVTESYGWARTKESLEGKGLGSINRDDLRKSDKWFLKTSGIGAVLEKHSTEYLNITEEVWADRVVDPEKVKEMTKYPPVLFDEMYAQVPTRLFELRGGTFLSLAKYRLNHKPIVVSLTLKNLFGMIPGPSRSKFHGAKDVKLADTIVDINKIYRSIFNVKGIVDGVLTASIGRKPEEAINPVTAKNMGLLLGSEDCVTLDATVAAIEGKNPKEIEYLKLASEVFGGWENKTLEKAQTMGLRIFQ